MTPLLSLDAPWASIETALAVLAESGASAPTPDDLRRLRGLSMIEPDDPPRLSPRGERYWKAKFVLEDTAEARDALADILKEHAVVTGFCSALWGLATVRSTAPCASSANSPSRRTTWRTAAGSR